MTQKIRLDVGGQPTVVFTTEEFYIDRWTQPLKNMTAEFRNGPLDGETIDKRFWMPDMKPGDKLRLSSYYAKHFPELGETWTHPMPDDPDDNQFYQLTRITDSHIIYEWRGE